MFIKNEHDIFVNKILYMFFMKEIEIQKDIFFEVESDFFEVEFFENDSIKIQIKRKNISKILRYFDAKKLNTENFDFYMYQNQAKIKDIIWVKNDISKKLAQKLRENNISYLDSVGNCYIAAENFFLFVNTQKKQNKKEQNKEEKKNFWTYTNAKLVFALLLEPALLEDNYRNLSKILNISLGALSEGIKVLEQDNFVVSESKSKKILVNKKRLLDEFLLHFQECITPKNNQNIYRNLYKETLSDNSFKNKMEFDNKMLLFNKEISAILSGEYFAEELTNYIIPQKYTYYISKENVKSIIKHFRLLPDKEGDFILKNKFWTSELEKIFRQNPIFMPLLTYMDLIESQESRNLETAKIIYEKHLSSHFEW